MLESAETGKGVNWAYVLTDRLRTELRKLKLARKGHPANKPAPKATEKKKKEEPIKTPVKPSGRKPVTPTKKIKTDIKKTEESPSQGTRAAKRKLADDSQDGRRNRRRKVQIEVEESDDQEETEETEEPEETELSDSEDVTTSSSEATGGPPGFAPLLQALGEAGELDRAQSIPNASIPTDSSSEPDYDKRKSGRRGEEATVGVSKARKQAQGSDRMRKRLKKGEKPQKTLLGDPARQADAQTPEVEEEEPVRKKVNPIEAIARAANLIPSRPVDVFKNTQPDLRVQSVVNNALEKVVEEKMSANIPLPVAVQQVVVEIKGTHQTTPTLATPVQKELAATTVETVILPIVRQPDPVLTLPIPVQLTAPEVKSLPPVATYTGLMNQVEMQQLQSVVTSPENVCATERIPEVPLAAMENPLIVVKRPEQVPVVEQEAAADTQPQVVPNSVAEPEVVDLTEAVTEDPVQEARPDKGKEVAAEEATPDANPVEAGVYQKEFIEEIADLCTGGPSLVQLPARFEPMGDPMRPWEYVAAHAKAPSLHMNEVIRNDMDQNLYQDLDS
ncbi:hypothetical protein R1sor_014139 [Riccia sorocarpa]|uniref:Uncharacterized protein n=1 Tax=Riccia sorocarpa TaxID=122646 RepID=A0ABD3HCA8_9MARC